MRALLLAVIMLMPCATLAATNCRIVEYSDHYEAVCIGDGLPTIERPQAPAQPLSIEQARQFQTPVREQTDAPITEQKVVSTNRSFGPYRQRMTQP